MKNDRGQRPDTKSAASALGPDPLGHLFEQARRDGFTRPETDRLWRGVIAGSLAPVDPGRVPVGASGGGAATSGLGIKIAAALLVGGGIAAAVGTLAPWRSHDPSVQAGNAGAPPALVSRAQAVPVDSVPPIIAWEDLPRAKGAAAAERATGAAAEAPVSTHRARPRIESTVAAVAAVSVSPVAEPSVREPEVPSKIDSVDPESTASPRSLGPPPPAEGALLLEARRKLTSDPASALGLTVEDARRFPDGALAPERDVLAIEALERLGRRTEAQTRLAAFRARYPQSPHLARLDALVH